MYKNMGIIIKYLTYCAIDYSTPSMGVERVRVACPCIETGGSPADIPERAGQVIQWRGREGAGGEGGEVWGG